MQSFWATRLSLRVNEEGLPEGVFGLCLPIRFLVARTLVLQANHRIDLPLHYNQASRHRRYDNSLCLRFLSSLSYA